MHNQRIHHYSRSISRHDSPPRHRPPHDPHYAYHQPFDSTVASRRPCPHCRAPPTSFHMDAASGDLVCTTCGAVLDDHLRDEAAEWLEYNSVEDLARGKGPGMRARCGEVVDESRWVGGLMPTKISSMVYTGDAGFGGSGSGAGAGTSEEKRRLATVRNRLKRTHNMIDNMIEQEQKARYAEVVLERRANDARLERGEIEENACNEGGIKVEGDYEGLMAIRQDAQNPKSKCQENTANAVTPDREVAYESLKDKKWSLTDAILLFGTLSQVQQYSDLDFTLPDSMERNDEKWTQSNLEAERAVRIKKIDAVSRSSLHMLYMTFAILEGAAQKLRIEGAALGTFRQAVSWLLKFAAKNDGLRVKGIPPGHSSWKSKSPENTNVFLSMFGSCQHQHGVVSDVIGGTFSTSRKPPSLVAGLHRLKQCASLGSAIIYLSAKCTGVGRTLTEVCSAFGTYAIISNNEGSSGVNTNGDVEGSEALVRPKYCSRAMQELREAVPEVVLSQSGVRNGLKLGQDPASMISCPSVPSAFREETQAAPTEAETPYDGGIFTAASSNPVVASSLPTEEKHISDPERNPGNVASAEDEALADLTFRMGTSLNLPSVAINAAARVALQHVFDARSASTKKKNNLGVQRIRPSRKKNKSSERLKAQKDMPGDVIAIAALLLVCTAGGTMQRLGRQALNNNNTSNSTLSGKNMERTTSGSSQASMIFGSFDDLQGGLSSPSPICNITGETSIASSVARPGEHDALASWLAWSSQPPWHRDVSQMEKATGIPRKTIVSFYSREIYPRRSYFLGVAVTRVGGELAHDIRSAVPLMSLKNL